MRKTDGLSLHSYLFEVTVDRVLIQIKFPCSIGASLKIGKEENASREVKLANGVAEINHKLQLRTTLLYDNSARQYIQKKGSRRSSQAALYIHVISQTGRNTAGICPLNLPEIIAHTPYDMVRRPLERCPDHDAQVSYRIRCKFEEELPYQELEGSGDFGRQASEGKNSKTQLSLVHQSAEFSMMESQSKQKLENELTSPTREFRQQPKQPVSAQPVRLLEEVESDLGWRPRLKPVMPRITQRKPTNESQNTSSSSRIIRPVGNSETMLEVERRAARLQAEKDNQQKEIANLTAQMETLRTQLFTKNNKESELTSQLDRIRRKAESQELQMETLRKNQQKTGKISQKVSQEFQQKLTRISDLEQELRVMRAHRENAEKAAKEKGRQAQQLSQRLEDITSSQGALQKRLDMKDNFYKEQMKKYSQKLVECELQKQKMLSELEALRGSTEDKDRRVQSLLKQRDKLIQDEKVKVNKKYDQLRQEHQKLNNQKLAERQELLVLNSNLEKLKASNAEYGLEKIRLQQEIERLKTKLVAEALQRGRLEQQLKDRTVKASPARPAQTPEDRKQKNDLLETLERQLDQKIQLNRLLSDKASQLQKRLKQRQLKAADQQFELDSLRKKYETAKKKIEQLSNQQTDLTNQLQQLQKNKVDLQTQLRKSQREFEDQKAKNGRLLAELDDKSQMLTEMQDSKLRASTNSMRLEERIRKLTEENKGLIEQRDGLVSKESDLAASLEQTLAQRDILRTQSENNQKLAKEKQTMILALHNEIDELKHQITKAQCLRNLQKDAASQLTSDLEKMSADKEQIFGKYEQLQVEFSRAKMESEQLNRKLQIQLDQRNQELKNKDQQIIALQAEFEGQQSQLQNMNDQYNVRIQRISDQLAVASKMVVQLETQNGTLQSSLTNSRTDLQCYQQNALETVKLFSQILSNGGQFEQNTHNPQIWIILHEVLVAYRSSQTGQQTDKQLLQKEKQQLQQLLSTSKQQRQQLQQQITTLSIEIDMKQQQISQIQSKLTQRQQQFRIELENTRQQQLNLQGNLQQLTDQLHAALQSEQALALANEQLQKRLAGALAESEKLRADLVHSEKQLKYKQAEIDAANSQLTYESKSLTELRDRVYAQQSDLEKQLEATKAELVEKTAQLQELETAKTKQIELRTEVETLKFSLIQAQEKIFSASVQIEDLNEKLKVSAKRDRQLAEKISSAQNAMLLQETSLSQLQMSHLGWQSRFKDTQQLLRASQKQRQLLTRRLADYQAQAQNTDFVVASMRAEMEAAQQELDEALNSLRNKDAYSAIIEEELSGKTKELSEMTRQLAKLKDANSRVNNELAIMKGELEQLEQCNTNEKKGLLEELDALNVEYNELRVQLQQELTVRQGLKAAYQKQRQQWQYRQSKLQAQVVELNQQMYSISSDVNTMRLRQEQDQQTLDKLQQQNATLIQLYLAQKKKNTEGGGNPAQLEDLQVQVEELRNQLADKSEFTQRLAAENEYLQRQIFDNPLVKELEDKAQQIARAYDEELVVLQQMLNRQRKDFECLRREYHQKCVIYQQKIRALQIQFRAREDQQRLETIEQQKSSNLSQITKINTENPDEDELKRLSRELQHRNSDIMIYEQQIRQMEQTITKLESSSATRDLAIIQRELKRVVSQRSRLTDSIQELTGLITQIKAKALSYCRLPAQNRDLQVEFANILAKAGEVLETAKEVEQSWPKGPSPTQSTDIMQSTSLRDLRNGQQLPVITTSPTSPKMQRSKY